MNTFPSAKPKYALLLVLISLLSFASSHCLAMMEIASVSKEAAKEMGVQLRVKENGPNEVWVELEFKAEGKLKEFSHVSLEIREGGKLLVGYAALKEKRPGSGSVIVQFMASRAYLDKITLMIVTGVAMNMTGHELRIKDFAGLTKVP